MVKFWQTLPDLTTTELRWAQSEPWGQLIVRTNKTRALLRTCRILHTGSSAHSNRVSIRVLLRLIHFLLSFFRSLIPLLDILLQFLFFPEDFAVLRDDRLSLVSTEVCITAEAFSPLTWFWHIITIIIVVTFIVSRKCDVWQFRLFVATAATKAVYISILGFIRARIRQ